MTKRSPTSDENNIAFRISAAVKKLVEEGKPITRKAIAEIAGCQLRTVSLYKSIWKEYAPAFQNSPQSRRSPFLNDQEYFAPIIESLSQINPDNLEKSALEAFIAKVRFYADCCKRHPESYEKVRAIGKRAQKVLAYLSSE